MAQAETDDNDERKLEDNRRVVHDVCEHTEPFETCTQGSCPALRYTSSRAGE